LDRKRPLLRECFAGFTIPCVALPGVDQIAYSSD
jgi:hypothetical protein